MSFSNMTRGRNLKQYEMLNKAFLEFVDDRAHEFLSEDGVEKIKNIVRKKMGEKWTFASSYSSYLTPFFKFGNISKRSDTNKKYTKKFFPYNKEEFYEIYQNTPISDLIADKKSQEIFNIYIFDMFSYLHHRLLREEKIIEHELNQKVKEQKVEMRKRAEISTSFGTLNDPLLRMFMMFAFDCIHFLSQDENTDNQKFWKYLEQNVDNGISLEDENFNGEDSLFTFLEKELNPQEGEEKEQEKTDAYYDRKYYIITLIKKAKFIYLLQNYHYF